MLIAISGSQGLGKSTLIDALSRTGINTITRKTSRSILSDWGKTLQEINNDEQLTLAFQDEILKRKFADEEEACRSPYLWVTERSYADLFAYALAAMGKNNTTAAWFDNYYKRCVDNQRSYSAVVYLTSEGRLTTSIVNDGVRSVNYHYSKMIDLTMEYYTDEMAHGGGRVFKVGVGTVEERLEVFNSVADVVLNSADR